MAHIVEFEVAGLAGRSDVLKQKLNRDVNVFFGLNGSGKTSLLKILNSAMENDTSMLDAVPFEWAMVKIYSVDYNKEFAVTLEKAGQKRREPTTRVRRKAKKTRSPEDAVLEDESGFHRIRKESKLAWHYKPKLPQGSSGSWRHRYLPTWRLQEVRGLFPYKQLREVPAPVSSYDWDFVFARSIEVLWSRYTNQLLSNVEKIQGKGLVSILQGILSKKVPRRKSKPLDPQKAYMRVAAFLNRQGSEDILGPSKTFVKRYNEDPQIRRVVDDINSVEQWIEEAKVSRNRLEQLITDMFTGNKAVIFEDTGINVITDDGHNISLASLSSGEKHALWIFIETLLAEVGTILIDEPEISLHIDWQKRLVPAMQQLNPESQLILATHSPEVMVDVPDDKIFRL